MSDVAPRASGGPADGGPELPLAALQALARSLPPERIDELWLFPPRAAGGGQSTVIVASTFDPGGNPDRRTIITARFTASRKPGGHPETRLELSDDGAAPPERVGRVVDGVIRRLDDDPAPPRYAHVQGDPERWQALLAALSAPDA